MCTIICIHLLGWWRLSQCFRKDPFPKSKLQNSNCLRSENDWLFCEKGSIHSQSRRVHGQKGVIVASDTSRHQNPSTFAARSWRFQGKTSQVWSSPLAQRIQLQRLWIVNFIYSSSHQSKLPTLVFIYITLFFR